MNALLPFHSPQSGSIWPFIEVEDKGRRSGLRERVGTKTWVAMLCFPRSALRALSLSLSRPLLTPRCPGWWGFLSKLPSSNHSPLHQPLHYNASNYLQCNLLYQANIAKLIESSCPSYRLATTLLCINHCIVMHPTICNIVNLVNWERPSCCGTNTLLLPFVIYAEYDI